LRIIIIIYKITKKERIIYKIHSCDNNTKQNYTKMIRIIIDIYWARFILVFLTLGATRKSLFGFNLHCLFIHGGNEKNVGFQNG